MMPAFRFLSFVRMKNSKLTNHAFQNSPLPDINYCGSSLFPLGKAEELRDYLVGQHAGLPIQLSLSDKSLSTGNICEVPPYLIGG